MHNKSTNKKDVRQFDIKPEKFWRYVAVKSNDECWPWARGKNNNGYGLYSVNNTPEIYEETGRAKTQLVAHRVAYFIHNGDIKPSDYACHSCDNPSCCNPRHIWLGSQLDNVRDMVDKGRAYWQS